MFDMAVLSSVCLEVLMYGTDISRWTQTASYVQNCINLKCNNTQSNHIPCRVKQLGQFTRPITGNDANSSGAILVCCHVTDGELCI